MNAEALRLTRETGEVHFFSRSRQRAVAQGRDLGQRQRVRQLRSTATPTRWWRWSTGRAGLSHRGALLLSPRARRRHGAHAPRSRPRHEALAALERTLADRARERPEGSYTVELLDDPERIGAKVREEADEVARAAAGESDERLAEEAADVLYHLRCCCCRASSARDGAGGAQ